MAITASEVAKLRETTGAGMMDAKNALTEANGDMEKAIDILRKSGAAKMAKKSERTTGEGRVHCYSHGNGKIGVLVEVMCETDFVGRNEQFVELCNDIAMHIAASAPLYISRDEVPTELVEKEKKFVTESLAEEKKPVEIIAKIVEGRMSKYFADICLMEQAFIKDDTMTVGQLLESKILSIGENIRIGRFSRIQLGAE
jgi:elongation factor Ts